MSKGIDWMALGQRPAEESGVVMRDLMRGAVREMLAEVMAEEVAMLCGPSHCPAEGAAVRRAGSAPGHVLVEGKRADVRRPRVRRSTADGETEMRLATYAAAQDPAELQANILLAFRAGVSGRDQAMLHGEKTRGVSKSAVSRLWIKAGAAYIEKLRGRDLAGGGWVALMIDGIGLGKDTLAIVALGIDRWGYKQILDFEIGSSESAAVCNNLLARVKQRGFGPMPGHDLLGVLDGSSALRKSFATHFSGSPVQRCLVHKERNLRGYLSKKRYGELAGLFKNLRQAQGAEAGREAFDELRAFVKKHNAAALLSFDEAGEDLIALHNLNVPATLHVSLLSTNIIENPFRNVRNHIDRVCRWNGDACHAERWLAYGLGRAEDGFRRIRGYADLDHLVEALRRNNEAEPPADVSATATGCRPPLAADTSLDSAA